MTTAIIIIAAVLAFGLAVAWLTRKREKKPAQEGTQAVGTKDVAEGWDLKEIPTGMKVDINGTQAEIVNIALVCDRKPSYRRSYDVAFDFDYRDGSQTICLDGKVDENTTFAIGGKLYYGTILAGGPDAHVTAIKRMTVK